MIRSKTPKALLITAAFLIVAGMLSACDENPRSVKGFVLPQGDIERGQAVFASVGCRECHVVANLDLPALEQPPLLNIALGGKVAKVKSYGDLLTSIVNPNHEIASDYFWSLDSEERKNAQTAMPDFNHALTVTQLIDLTAFLHSRYELLGSEYRGYRYVR